MERFDVLLHDRTSFELSFIGFFFFIAGALLGDLLDHAVHGRFNWFIRSEPFSVALTVPVTLTALYFLGRQVNRVLVQENTPPEKREQTDLHFEALRMKYKATPFIRAAVYLGFYLLGVLFPFIF